MGTQIKIEMPRISADGGSDDSEAGEGAVLAAWLVEVGGTVEQGEIIAELETDKSTLELEAPAAGVIGEIRVEAGTENVVPGALLAILEASDTAAESPEPSNGRP